MTAARSLSIALSLVLTACTAPPPRSPELPPPVSRTPPVETAGAEASAPPREPETAQSPAAQLLLAQADDALDSADYEGAAALVERALRIDPQDGRLWLQLASVRFAQQRFADALSLARRARALAGGDRDLQSECDALIARAAERADAG